MYTNSTAGVLTNGIVSKPVTLERSTRQGSPLSPVLFILAIEPLAMAIRTQVNLTGIRLGEQEQRISLFADDVIIFLTKLATKIPNLIQQIEKFGRFSGYTMNYSKSSTLFLNKEERSKPIIRTPFINSMEGFTYLGVKITPEIKTITRWWMRSRKYWING